MTGESSRVATTVAIEFAASCRPFRKSNSSARTISPISRGRASSCTAARSGVVDDDAVVLERLAEAVRVDRIRVALDPNQSLGQLVEARPVARDIAQQRQGFGGEP